MRSTPKELILVPLLFLKYGYYMSLNISVNMSLTMSLNILVEKETILISNISQNHYHIGLLQYGC
jgi:hypothetical protein